MKEILEAILKAITAEEYNCKTHSLCCTANNLEYEDIITSNEELDFKAYLKADRKKQKVFYEVYRDNVIKTDNSSLFVWHPHNLKARITWLKNI